MNEDNASSLFRLSVKAFDRILTKRGYDPYRIYPSLVQAV